MHHLEVSPYRKYTAFDPCNFPDFARPSCVSVNKVHGLADPALYRVSPGHRHVNAPLWLSTAHARVDRPQGLQHIVVDESVQIRNNIHAIVDEEHESEDDPEHDDGNELTNRKTVLFSRCDKNVGIAGRPSHPEFPILEHLISAATPHGPDRDASQRALTASRGRNVAHLDPIMPPNVLGCQNLQNFEHTLLARALTSPRASVLSVSLINLQQHGQRDESYFGGLARMFKSGNLRNPTSL